MKKRTILIVVIAAILTVSGVAVWRNKKQKAEERRASRTVEAVLGPLEVSVEATGEVVPLNRVEIQPPIAGRIEKLLVDEGDRVKEGEVLAWMSSSDRAAILDAAKAQGAEEVKRWEDTYKPTPVVAPLSGTVILRNVVVGQTVTAGTILYAISDKLIVLTHVDEVDIGRVRTGMPARITLDAFPGRSVDGKVFNILYEGKNVSNVITYDVKVAPDAVPPFFRSQMTANVKLIISQKENAVLLPADAVREAPDGGRYVLAPSAGGGRPEQRPVEVGAESGADVEIVSGLKPGDVVLVSRGRYKPQSSDTASSPFMPKRPGARATAAPGGGQTRNGGGSSPRGD
ncbi:MAG TPA: efflux RND transporter periplasmic adaptor subunit [Elusimicrobiota bacterium]|nr:efflux RND transporter periplasmic adaptor subunit [Elusimicrobiota bacterium]